MAQNIHLPDAIELKNAFLANPADQTLQVRVVDISRRFPIAWALLLAGRYEDLFSAAPSYMTFRKLNDGCITYEKTALPTLLESIRKQAGSDEDDEASADDLDTVDQATTTVSRPTRPARVKQAVGVASGSTTANSTDAQLPPDVLEQLLEQ